jgi:hypothetical protein
MPMESLDIFSLTMHVTGASSCPRRSQEASRRGVYRSIIPQGRLNDDTCVFGQADVGRIRPSFLLIRWRGSFLEMMMMISPLGNLG